MHAGTPGGLSHRPWCYTADPRRRWQYCNVPSCGEFYSDVIQSVLPSNHNLTVLHHTCNLGVSRVVLPRQQVAQRSGLAHCMVQGARVSYRGVSPGKSPPPPPPQLKILYVKPLEHKANRRVKEHESDCYYASSTCRCLREVQRLLLSISNWFQHLAGVHRQDQSNPRTG